MASLRLLSSSLVCSCNKEDRSLGGTVLVLLETLCGEQAQGLGFQTMQLRLSLSLKGCELETYFGHWHANELTKCPNFLVYLHYLHSR